MIKKTIPVTMEAIEELLDRKLDEKLDEKLKPVHEEIATLHGEISNIKDVVENRVYKELKETRKEMRDGFARLDKVATALV